MSIFQDKKIFFVGIGGIGNSALAQILFQKGNKVSGADSNKSDITVKLENKGIKVFKEHSSDNIEEDLDYLIYSPAIPPENPERLKAEELGIQQLSYPDALAELSKEYFTIAIAGTHGKSTTTAIASLILIEAGLDPTVVIGTKVREFENQNYRLGKSKYLIIEACEYKRSFQNFQPNILAITNLELDHLDYFKDEKDYLSAFQDLADKSDIVICNKGDAKSRLIKSSKKIEWGSEDLKYKPQVLGKFNQENATTAAYIAKQLQIPEDTIQEAVKNFKGTWRRMEIKGKLDKTILIDDYAHHPTEIKVTLQALRTEYPEAKILCVFQPHQYSRTKLLLEKFAASFKDANEIIIPNIYQVRDSEEDLKSVSVSQLIAEISKHNPKVKDGQSIKNSANIIKEIYQNFDLIITMGAGNISSIYQYLDLN